MTPRQLVDPRSLWSVTALSGRELRCLLDTGLRLRRASREGPPEMPLRGRHLALLNGGTPDRGVARLRQAALDLGAQVSELRARDTGIGQGPDDGATVRLLGRLYDAIDCEALPPALVEDIASEAGVPVFDGLGSNCCASAIAELLPLPERCGKPFDALRLCYLGDPATACGAALLHLSAQCGIELRVVAPTTEPALASVGPLPGCLVPCPSCETACAEVDLVIDARDGRPWELPGVDAAERSANHRFTLQAMLLTTMA